VKPVEILILIAVQLVWGFNFGISRHAVQHIPPIFFMALRFAIIAAVLLPFARAPHGHWRGVALFSFTLGFVHFSLMMTGLKGIDAATAALASQIQVPVAAVLAAIFYKDYFGWRRTLGLCLGIAGIAVLVGSPDLDGRYVPLGLVIAGCCAWAVANLQIKQLSALDIATVNGWMSLMAVPQLLLASWFLEEGQLRSMREADVGSWVALAYQAFMVVIIGYALWQRALRLYPVNQVMPFVLLLPISGVLSGVIILGEPVTWWTAAGGLLTLAGVAIIILRRPDTGARAA
jgi:O-acetylserine/cysteine efflux transporter